MQKMGKHTYTCMCVSHIYERKRDLLFFCTYHNCLPAVSAVCAIDEEAEAEENATNLIAVPRFLPSQRRLRSTLWL